MKKSTKFILGSLIIFVLGMAVSFLVPILMSSTLPMALIILMLAVIGGAGLYIIIFFVKFMDKLIS